MAIEKITTTNNNNMYIKVPDRWEAIFNPDYMKLFSSSRQYLIDERNHTLVNLIPDICSIYNISRAEQDEIEQKRLYSMTIK